MDSAFNPLDEIYDAGKPSTTQGEQPSLNEEVAQLTSSIGKLWGGFRKQARDQSASRVQTIC